MTSIAKVIKVDQSIMLHDNDQWMNRFEIKSETSNRIYIIAQHKTKKFMGCSCPAWRRYRHCKHLESLGLPCYEQPINLTLTPLNR